MSESSAAAPADPVAPEAPADPAETHPAAPAATPAEGTPPRRGRSPRGWRDGGSSTRRWGWEVFGWAVLALGAGVIASATLATLVGGEVGSILGRLALWACFGAAIVVAFARSRPRGLLRFRAVDVLYGIALGGMLRLAQGTIDTATGGSGAWPSYPSLPGRLPPGWWFDELLTTAVIAPVLEEFFFRAVILVAVYTAVRRLGGRALAAITAALVSIGLFVLAHAVVGSLSLGPAASLALVGLVTSVLVLATGRIWGAVLVHVVYNATWVALATVGTLLT